MAELTAPPGVPQVRDLHMGRQNLPLVHGIGFEFRHISIVNSVTLSVSFMLP